MKTKLLFAMTFSVIMTACASDNGGAFTVRPPHREIARHTIDQTAKHDCYLRQAQDRAEILQDARDGMSGPMQISPSCDR